MILNETFIDWEKTEKVQDKKFAWTNSYKILTGKIVAQDFPKERQEEWEDKKHIVII